MTFRRTRCAHCRAKLTPERPSQIVHAECAEPYAIAKREKEERAQAKAVRMAARVEKAETRRRKAALMTAQDARRIAQRATNAFVLARDHGLPCISCGKTGEGAYHAGHYRSCGSAPHLALDLRNIHRQCAPCNLHLHGNLIEYRKGLIARFGEDFVLTLEADETPRAYKKHDYEAIAAERRAATRELKKGDRHG
ncbi:recombination protein NinG [Delftia deserti]|uniref:Recombination protein NinG n=1 Tax=Delftia deserti TaxID=1651218 RepID=A0ABW5EZN5_9BURK